MKDTVLGIIFFVLAAACPPLAIVFLILAKILNL